MVQHEKSHKPFGLLISLLPVAILVSLVSIVLWLFQDEATSGPAQVALLLSAGIAGLIAKGHGVSWEIMEESILSGIHVSMKSILIIMVIGALMGTWILAGIVPAMVVWGLELLDRSLFLPGALVISSMVSLATGSSWSTAGTVGIAVMGVGEAMGLSPGLTAGAIISGAYFGDKISPLSETTNLAPAVTGVDLFEHIRNMMRTTIPGFVLSLIFFTIAGFVQTQNGFDPARVQEFAGSVREVFYITPWLLVPPLVVLTLVLLRAPTLPILFLGAFLGALFAAFFQWDVCMQTVQNHSNIFLVPFEAGFRAAATGFHLDGKLDLFNRGGMLAMMNTVWLIISAMTFGGVMEGSGMLGRIGSSILMAVRGRGGLIAATAGTAIFINTTASEQYLSIAITGRMYDEAYDRANIPRKYLSRTLEDAGTMTSPLVPWNTCGAFMSSVLGVPVYLYAPFAILNWSNPIVAIIYGFLPWRDEDLKKD